MLMMVLIICMKIDFGSMLLHENHHQHKTDGKADGAEV